MTFKKLLRTAGLWLFKQGIEAAQDKLDSAKPKSPK